MPVIEARGLSRSFGKVQAVSDASIVLQPGRVQGLVGANGSGKTTLLLMLGTLIAPDSGSVKIDGINAVAAPREARPLIGWMPDALGAWPSLSVRETLEYTGQLYELSRADAAQRATELIERLDLETLADSPAKVLSRGQKQRLGLARALIHKPRILLLDEPAAGLDPEARILLRNLIREFADEGGSVLISSHVLSELEEIVDETTFMFDGATTAAEPLAEVQAAMAMRSWRIRTLGAQPHSAAIAELIGVSPSRVAVERHHLVVQFESEDEAARALAALVGQGVKVCEFGPESGELEQRFVQLHQQHHTQRAQEGASS